jgi:hypothetical protein
MRPARHGFPIVFSVLLLLTAASDPVLAKGTHFILEGGGGIGITDATASVKFWDVAFGYGGKFRSLPLRFYVVGNYSGDVSRGDGPSYTHRVTDNMLLVGPRIYIPVARNMRIYGQALFGGLWASAQWNVNGIEQYNPHDNGLAGKFSLGFQARLARWFSVGLVYDRMAFWGKQNDLVIPRLTGLNAEPDDGDQNRFGANIVVHF